MSENYVRGETYAQSDRPTFEFKASSPGSTGGGYPRIRSTEWRDHTSRRASEDVYVSVHRLAAVAWHLPDGTLGDDVRLADLDGYDVHHTLGMPSANGEDLTELLEHGGHSSVTNAQVRAWGEDAKESADDAGEVATEPDDGTCVDCGDELDTACRSPDWDGLACPECAGRLSDGAAIEVV